MTVQSTDVVEVERTKKVNRRSECWRSKGKLKANELDGVQKPTAKIVSCISR